MLAWRKGYPPIKRALDIAVALLSFALVLPLLVGIVTFLFLLQGRPILYVQNRIGHKEKAFRVYKFRTMSGDSATDHTSMRITRLGRILRRFSLDELPQLINVLRGDMSIVGPRPLLESYLPHYTDNQKLRHSVRPGITGLSQVRGRNSLSWAKRLALDTWYAKNVGLFLDARIVAQTISVVLSGNGIQASAGLITEPLMPTKSSSDGRSGAPNHLRS